jgi:hypothetical protein
MKLRGFTILLLGAILATAYYPTHAAQQRHPFDEYGIMDTVIIDVHRLEGTAWVATVHLYNDENLAAMTLPLRWRPQKGTFRLDSASYDGLRTEYFALKTFYPDTVAGTILIGLISDLGTGLPPLEPGRGAIARLYFTSLENPPKPLMIDTTFIRPHNVLQMVTPDVRSILPAFKSHSVSATAQPEPGPNSAESISVDHE